MMRKIVFAGIMASATCTAPVFAANFNIDAGDVPPSVTANPSAGAPSSIVSSSLPSTTPVNPASMANPVRVGDNATDSIVDASFPPQSGPSQDPMPTAPMPSPHVDAYSPLSSFGPSSGTVVGNRAVELRDEVMRLRSSVNLNANEFSVLRSSGAAGSVQYHSTVAAITARLQNGTTRGNPILLRQWDEAEASLGEVTTSLSRLNSLQTSVDADASMASYLLDSVQAAFQLSGAVDEDHDQLKLLRDEVSSLVVQLDYLRNQTTNDIERQTTYLTTERSNLQALAFAISRGELLGNSIANRPVVVTTSPVVSMPYTTPMTQASPSPPVTNGPRPMSPREYIHESSTTTSGQVGVAPSVGRLLVLIRYNQPVVDYEKQLSNAVGTAIELRPDAQFSVVAVSPSSGDPADLAQAQQKAQINAEAVKRSLMQLGLSPSRITMASTQIQTAQTPEVHVYIR
jgi:hypothetical protein